MSNIKHFHLQFTGPWDLLSGTAWHQYPDGPEFKAGQAISLSMAAVLLNPLTPANLKTTDLGSVPNANGGHTNIWRFTITGTEALAWPYFDELKFNIETVANTRVEAWEVIDIEA